MQKRIEDEYDSWSINQATYTCIGRSEMCAAGFGSRSLRLMRQTKGGQ